MNAFPEDERELLARLLLDIPLMQSADGRASIIAEMKRRNFILGVAVTAADMVDCVGIIDAAMGQVGGLQCLAHVAYFFDRTDAALEFKQYVEQRYPSEFLTPRQQHDLIRELDPLAPKSKLITFYQAATGELARERFENLDQVIREIGQIPWNEPGHPLIRLTEAIARNAASRGAARTARQWSDRLADKIDAMNGNTAEREFLDRLRLDGAGSPAEFGRPTLMLELHPDLPRPGHYRFTARLFVGHTHVEKIHESDDSNPLTLSGIKEIFVDILDSAITMADRIDPDSTDMDLEFLLPRNLLCLPIEEWTNREAAYRSLGAQFVVVVRDLARLTDPACRRASKKKWAILQQHPGPAYTTLHRWITCEEAPGELGQIYLGLLAGQYVSLGLTFHPRDGTHAFNLDEALDAGMPIAIWPRKCRHSGSRDAGYPGMTSANFKEMLSQQLADRPLTDLPEIVRGLRLASGLNPGLGMTLLWDDPTRLPVPDDFSLGAPTLPEGN